MAKHFNDSPPSSPTTTTTPDIAARVPTKCRRVSERVRDHDHDPPSPLIPGLPDHIAHHCLSHLHPTSLFSVNRSWRHVINSPNYPSYLALYTLLVLRPPLDDPSSICFSSFDPVTSTWHSLPPPPSDLRLLLLHHPSFLSRRFPIQSVSSSSRLILLAASTLNLSPALPLPLVFDPYSRSWSPGPALSVPRRWCATGSLGGSIYVASGIGSQFSIDVARTLERWDPDGRVGGGSRAKGWSKLTGLKDGRFCRDAIEAVGWKGKLCMVNIRGDASKQGVVYDTEDETWHEMKEGMLKGWRGPVAAMDEEIMYGVDERKGVLRRYDEAADTWAFVGESERLIGAEQIAAAGGRVCAVCTGGEIAVVDVAGGGLGRVWVVEPPPGLQAVGVHILPRMAVNEYQCIYGK